MMVLEGIEYAVVLASEVSDGRRIELDLLRAALVVSARSVCLNDADARSGAHYMCDCCLAVCPDVHRG